MVNDYKSILLHLPFETQQKIFLKFKAHLPPGLILYHPKHKKSNSNNKMKSILPSRPLTPSCFISLNSKHRRRPYKNLTCLFKKDVVPPWGKGGHTSGQSWQKSQSKIPPKIKTSPSQGSRIFGIGFIFRSFFKKLHGWALGGRQLLYSVSATQDSLGPHLQLSGEDGQDQLLLGFGRVAWWGDRAPSRIQTTELAIFTLVLVSWFQDL